MQPITATCSKCGNVLTITGRETKEIVFGTKTTETTEKTQVVLSVTSCVLCMYDNEKHVILKFGELDGMPEV